MCQFVDWLDRSLGSVGLVGSVWLRVTLINLWIDPLRMCQFVDWLARSAGSAGSVGSVGSDGSVGWVGSVWLSLAQDDLDHFMA